jgi:DNA modification methylase
MEQIQFPRVVCQGNKWTFEMKPFRKVLEQLIQGSKRILVPFAGYTRFQTDKDITYIDLASDVPHPYIRGNCLDIIPKLEGSWDLVIADPPFSMFQAVRTYDLPGGLRRMQDITRMKQLLEDRITPNGLYVQFGYTSTGFREDQGFKLVDGLLCNLGGSHNDIIMIIQQKEAIKNE